MVSRWVRLLIIAGVSITLAIFVVALALYFASLLWLRQQPTIQSASGSQNPFTEQVPQSVASGASSTPPTPPSIATVAPAIQQTAELETIGRALETYRHASMNNQYPNTLSDLVKESYLVTEPSSSYHYFTGGTYYSVCILASGQYECVLSDVGAENPVTFPAAAIDTSSPAKWKQIEWTGADATVRLLHPPGWTYSGSTYTLSLNATDLSGAPVQLARVTLSKYIVDPSKTFDQVEQRLIAIAPYQITNPRKETAHGFPIYQALIINDYDQSSSQTFEGEQLLVDADGTNIFQLNLLMDRTLAPLMMKVLSAMGGYSSLSTTTPSTSS